MRVARDPEWLQGIAARLAATRDALGLRDIDLAKTVGASASRWGNYMQAKRPLDIEAAIRLCNRYQLTLDWIYRGVSAGLPLELGDKLDPAPRTGSKVVSLNKRR